MTQGERQEPTKKQLRANTVAIVCFLIVVVGAVVSIVTGEGRTASWSMVLCTVPALALQVIAQHFVDGRLVRVQARGRADRFLAGWGFGCGECLADGAAVNSVFAGELADGQAIDSRVVADVGVQLHS